jgi:hypothetical protein
MPGVLAAQPGTRTLIIAATLLALGLGVAPAHAQSANGFSPIAGCSLIAYDVNTATNSVNGGGTVLTGLVNVAVPCDASVVVVRLITQIITSAAATISSEIAANCVAPAVPGGCTVGSPAAVPIPNLGILLDQGGTAAPRQTRSAEGVFVGLAKGNYTFQANLRQSGAGTLAVDQRSFIVEVTGGLPVTPPGSSQ